MDNWFISTGYHGKTEEEIVRDLDRGEILFNEYYGDPVVKFHYGYSINKNLPKPLPTSYIANDIAILGGCTGIIMLDGWEKYRGCRIEHMVAKEYGLKILYEKKEKCIDSLYELSEEYKGSKILVWRPFGIRSEVYVVGSYVDDDQLARLRLINHIRNFFKNYSNVDTSDEAFFSMEEIFAYHNSIILTDEKIEEIKGKAAVLLYRGRV